MLLHDVNDVLMEVGQSLLFLCLCLKAGFLLLANESMQHQKYIRSMGAKLWDKRAGQSSAQQDIGL